jgi:hypothetical protein
MKQRIYKNYLLASEYFALWYEKTVTLLYDVI